MSAKRLLFLAEGRCEGWISGRFRGANFPRRHGAEGPFRPDFRAVIEAEDGAVIMVEWHGYGRAYPPGRRQVVGALFHLADQSPTDTPAGYLRQPNDCAHGQPLSRLSESGPWRRLAAASRQAAMTGQPVTVNVPDPTLPLW